MELDAALVSLNKAAAGPVNKVGGTGSSSAAPAANAGNQAGKKKKYVLNASDKLFSQLRDQNFAVVGGMLNKIAKRINENYEVRSCEEEYSLHVLMTFYPLGKTSCKNCGSNT